MIDDMFTFFMLNLPDLSGVWHLGTSPSPPPWRTQWHSCSEGTVADRRGVRGTASKFQVGRFWNHLFADGWYLENSGWANPACIQPPFLEESPMGSTTSELCSRRVLLDRQPTWFPEKADYSNHKTYTSPFQFHLLCLIRLDTTRTQRTLPAGTADRAHTS
jgi:hypothetical protein